MEQVSGTGYADVSNSETFRPYRRRSFAIFSADLPLGMTKDGRDVLTCNRRLAIKIWEKALKYDIMVSMEATDASKKLPDGKRSADQIVARDEADLKNRDANASGHGRRVEQAEARVEQAEARVEQAEARTEQAEARTEQSEARTEQANTRTEQANTRTEKAEVRTEQAETRTEQAKRGRSKPRRGRSRRRRRVSKRYAPQN